MDENNPTLLQYMQQVDGYLAAEYPVVHQLIAAGLMPMSVQQQCSRIIWDNMLSGVTAQCCCGDIVDVARRYAGCEEDK